MNYLVPNECHYVVSTVYLFCVMLNVYYLDFLCLINVYYYVTKQRNHILNMVGTVPKFDLGVGTPRYVVEANTEAKTSGE